MPTDHCGWLSICAAVFGPVRIGAMLIGDVGGTIDLMADCDEYGFVVGDEPKLSVFRDCVRACDESRALASVF